MSVAGRTPGTTGCSPTSRGSGAASAATEPPAASLAGSSTTGAPSALTTAPASPPDARSSPVPQPIGGTPRRVGALRGGAPRSGRAGGWARSGRRRPTGLRAPFLAIRPDPGLKARRRGPCGPLRAVLLWAAVQAAGAGVSHGREVEVVEGPGTGPEQHRIVAAERQRSGRGRLSERLSLGARVLFIRRREGDLLGVHPSACSQVDAEVEAIVAAAPDLLHRASTMNLQRV